MVVVELAVVVLAVAVVIAVVLDTDTVYSILEHGTNMLLTYSRVV